ncbi:hypothetical protein OSB04_023080 [Centaurea solstitialis]|uniref:Nucleolar protein 10 n=1 Tax=Centaurea solstitialis TaxID=347529 RepID=A0AA38SJ71_9ASTR|nr:hypothetical protein OSB04_023080 [Centaurea solstitialis]
MHSATGIPRYRCHTGTPRWCILAAQARYRKPFFPAITVLLRPVVYKFARAKMYLQFYINENGDKVYTTKKESPHGLATQSAHPARFSPDDKFSRQRVLLKKRFGLLPTQKPAKKY